MSAYPYTPYAIKEQPNERHHQSLNGRRGRNCSPSGREAVRARTLPTVLVYWPPGVGKTWVSLDFPAVYYIDTEGGSDLDHYRAKLRASGGAYLGPDQGSLDFDVVISQIRRWPQEQHHYRTVVIDSVSELWNVALSDERERLGAKDAFGAYKELPNTPVSVVD